MVEHNYNYKTQEEENGRDKLIIIRDQKKKQGHTQTPPFELN